MSHTVDSGYPVPRDRDDDEPIWSDEFEETTCPSGPSLELVPRNASPAGGTYTDRLNAQLKRAVLSMAADREFLTANEVVAVATESILGMYDPLDPPAPEQVERDLLRGTRRLFEVANAGRDKDDRLVRPRAVSPWQIAKIVLRLHHAIRIMPSTQDSKPDYDALALYQWDGQRAGTYTISTDEIHRVARLYDRSLTRNGAKEVEEALRAIAPRWTVSLHRDLVPMANGVFYSGREPLEIEINGTAFRFEPKTLHDFDPALVFVAKSHVNYVDGAPSPVYTDYDGWAFDFDSWLADLFDLPDGRGEGMVQLMWEILSAILRPHVSWRKAAFFYSESGNNGKGTLCTLMRNLLGPGTYASVPLSEMGKEFALESLMSANAIIVDENDVGMYIDKAAGFKTLVTNDVIQINRKHEKHVAFQFWGLMVQCLNEFPLFKDKSESLYRRQLFVPFEKSFTGAERKYIKDDYLQRPELLEYVAYRALQMDHYELSEPPATKLVLDEFKEMNDPVRTFWGEHRLEFVWDLLPFRFLYDAFKAWSMRVNPSGRVASERSFTSDLVAIVRKDEIWDGGERGQRHRPGNRMDRYEPMIIKYDLRDWMHLANRGPSGNSRARPSPQAQYRGLVLRPSAAVRTLSEQSNAPTPIAS